MSTYAFRVRFGIPVGMELSGGSSEIDSMWHDHPIHLHVKSYRVTPDSEATLYECYGKPFDTREECTECGTDVSRLIARAALARDIGVNFWDDYVPGHLTGYLLSISRPVVAGTTYADHPGLHVYEDDGQVSFVHLDVKLKDSSCSLDELASAIAASTRTVRPSSEREDLALGKRLAAVLEEPDAGFEGDVRESNEWAAMVGISDWFEWQAFEDMPASYLGSRSAE